MSMFRNIFKTKTGFNKKYVEMEKKVKDGSYQDRIDVMAMLERDRDKHAKAIEILTWILHNGSSHSGDMIKLDERAIAAGTLGKTGGEHALRALEGALGIPSLDSSVNYAIAEIRKKQDQGALIESLKTSPVSTMAVLTERKDDSGIECAMKLLDSPDITTAVSAARYLGIIQYQPAVDKLVKLVQSDYIDIQHTAAVALGRIGGPTAKTALLEALHHKSDWAASGAVKGLAFMWENGEKDVLDKIGDIKRSGICSKDSEAEKENQFEAVNNMYLSLYKSPAVVVSGAVITDTDKSKVTYHRKCDACGYISSQKDTTIISFKGKMLSLFDCPDCKNRQNVVIEGPK